jgi:hypothetical protein
MVMSEKPATESPVDANKLGAVAAQETANDQPLETEQQHSGGALEVLHILL